ncbi:hypothetical protein TIFTF001_015216 [Ficus carica]|uniref:Uncharacterized protein n=1 Tax=Ficus carica TaxID=3494 RepID=A0AA88AS79_FICCA|nr:hypothetical protein TIFTF001_015216 [Ficus carica]
MILKPLSAGPWSSQAIEHEGCAPSHIYGLSPMLVQVMYCSRQWFGCSRACGLGVAASRAHSAWVFISLLTSEALPVGPVTPPVNRGRHVLQSAGRPGFGHSRRGFLFAWAYAVLVHLSDAGVVGYSVNRLEQIIEVLDVLVGSLVHNLSGQALGERDTSGVSVTGTPMLKSVRAFSAGSSIRVTQSGRLPSVPGDTRVAEVGDVMYSSWLCVRRQAAIWESCQEAATSYAHGTPCYRLTVRSSRVVSREESSGRIKSGQQYPIQADGYFHLHMTGLLLEIGFCGRDGI